MATGIAVSGCGLGAFILAPLFQLIYHEYGYCGPSPQPETVIPVAIFLFFSKLNARTIYPELNTSPIPTPLKKIKKKKIGALFKNFRHCQVFK
jgi:hypothetical protein